LGALNAGMSRPWTEIALRSLNRPSEMAISRKGCAALACQLMGVT
jgi:hypothetical protein